MSNKFWLGNILLKYKKSFIKGFTLCIVPLIVFQIFRVGTLMIFAFNNSSSTSAETTKDVTLPKSERINLLLLGEDDAAKLTDVIMLVSLDKYNNSVFILQIPRDTYAEYTSASYRKLNAARNVLDGGRQLADFFEYNLGIQIDHFVIFDLEAVSKIVDALGGIEIDVPVNMSYSDPYQDLVIEINSGKQVLNGEKAKQFVRFREGYVRGDLDRLDVQKLFLSALLKKVSSADIQCITKAALNSFSYIESDMSYKDCIDIVMDYRGVEAQSVMLSTLPGSDIRGSSGAWYYIMNREAAYVLISEKFYSDLAYDEFDKNRKFTSTIRAGFNDIYEAKNQYRAVVYSAEDINNAKIN